MRDEKKKRRSRGRGRGRGSGGGDSTDAMIPASSFPGARQAEKPAAWIRHGVGSASLATISALFWPSYHLTTRPATLASSRLRDRVWMMNENRHIGRCRYIVRLENRLA
jgi:hypothetical protein